MKKSGNIHYLSPQSKEKSIQVVVFEVENRKFGVSVKKTLEIIFHRKILALPSPQGVFKGVLNLRGHIIPVVPAFPRFGLVLSKPVEDCSFIILDIRGHEAGFIVDWVNLSLLQVNIADLETNETNSLPDNPIQGILNTSDGKIEILYPDKLLNSEEIRELITIKESF